MSPALDQSLPLAGPGVQSLPLDGAPGRARTRSGGRLWTRRALTFGLLSLCCATLSGDARQSLPWTRSRGSLEVTVTAYCDGWITASGRRPRPGIIALSRDVERALGLRFGDQVQLAGLGTYVFDDRMPWYWWRRVDLYLGSRAAAVQFGLRRAVLTRTPREG
jgi:3D (Asp-Asp-Asp) domain-containing protein